MEDNKRDTVTVVPERGTDVQHVEGDLKVMTASQIHQEHGQLYLESIQRYPVDEDIDPEAEKRLRRKMDIRILPLLGICYLFYVRVPLSFQSVHSDN